jgi:hypothetical protein
VLNRKHNLAPNIASDEESAEESIDNTQKEEIHYKIAPIDALQTSDALNTAPSAVEVRSDSHAESTPYPAISIPNRVNSSHAGSNMATARFLNVS